ncbi:MAG: lactoylglutathione lyase [Arenicella sp.]|jgi:lactoylglutathione lyase
MRRILHAMIRVGNMADSIAFYTDVMGMKLQRKFIQEEAGYELAFVGYEEEENGFVIELTHNFGVSEYDLGDGYGHIAIAVDDCYQACERIREKGGEIIRDAGPLKGGEEIIAFVKDVDGYKIELIERPKHWF